MLSSLSPKSITDNSEKLSTGIYVLHQPVYDLRCKFYAFSSQFGLF